jgi:uncharacterized protein (TIGR02284 family)
MENISNKDLVKDLQSLIDTVNDGKDGYESSSEATDSIELKGVFLKYAAQRAGFAQELADHIKAHGGDADEDGGGVLGALHRTWIDIKQALSSKEDAAILSAIVTGEQAALERYDQTIFNYALHEDHIELLRAQRFAVAEALREIVALHEQFLQRS